MLLCKVVGIAIGHLSGKGSCVGARHVAGWSNLTAKVAVVRHMPHDGPCTVAPTPIHCYCAMGAHVVAQV
jgi:hypothetical protein